MHAPLAAFRAALHGSIGKLLHALERVTAIWTSVLIRGHGARDYTEGKVSAALVWLLQRATVCCCAHAGEQAALQSRATMNLADLTTLFPFVILAVGGVLLLLVDLVVPPSQKMLTGWLAFVVALAGGIAALTLVSGEITLTFGGMVRGDAFAFFADALLCAIAALVILLSLRYNAARSLMRGEFYPLLLLSLSGMSLAAHAADLLIVFLAIELLSIPLYVLSGFARSQLESEESALKYFLTGAFASGFLVYGIALIYGATGTTALSAMHSAPISAAALQNEALLRIGLALVIGGLLFKVAVVPFHFWAPDVYEGAPTVVTAFMATATKAAAFLALVRVLAEFTMSAPVVAQPVFDVGDELRLLLAALSALTMIIGNAAALLQNNVKRMLAYSSVAHAGYALAGVAAGDAVAVLFYLAAYAFATIAAFAVLVAVGSTPVEEHSYEAYSGLGRQAPVLGLTMALSMFSLIGIPPTAGFVGKYLLFQAIVASDLVWLALLGVLTSVLSAAFYLRVVMTLFMREPEAESAAPVSDAPRAAAAYASVVAVLAIGLFPSLLLSLLGGKDLSAFVR